MIYHKSARLTLWSIRFFMLALLALSIAAPWVCLKYAELRKLLHLSGILLLVTYYVCVPPAAYSLYAMHRLMENFLRGLVFDRMNVRLVRHISLCCLVVSLFTTLGTLNYQPLIFVAVLMGFLYLVVRVVANLLEAATSLREENDLTI